MGTIMSGLCYGGDYNPEQWDEATFEADLELMKEAGVNLVSVAIFAWSKLEPTEGVYDFDWLARILDRLHEAGIYVDLATGTASPPVWMARDYPQTLPVTAEGVRLGFGSRQQYCPSSPIFREKSVALAKALATRFGSHPALRLWHVSNEYGCHVHECFCAECAEAFRRWLGEKYGSVESLNRAWGTDFWAQRYGDFSQVEPPRAMPTFPNPTQVLDWRRFCSDALIECFDLEAEQLRLHSPGIPVTTNLMGLFAHIDYWKLASHLDIVSDDSYPDPADPASAAAVALEADLARSYRRAPFLLMEQSPSAVQWRQVNSPKRPGQNALWSLQRIAQGADGIMHFQWRQSKAGAETFHAGMVPHSGRRSRIFAETCELGQILAKLESVTGSPLETPVALLWDWDSEWARASAIGPTAFEFGQGLRKWHRTLFEAGFTSDIVSPATLPRLFEAGSLEGYRLVVVPEIFMGSQVLSETLEKLAEAGAQVIVAGPSFIVDADLQAFNGEGVFPLERLTGVRLIEPWPSSPSGERDHLYEAPDPRTDGITSAIYAPSEQEYVELDPQDGPFSRVLDGFGSPRPAPRGSRWAELIEPTDPQVEVLATYLGRGSATDLAGCPALTRRRIGQGNCFYTSTDLDAVGRAALLKLAATHARLQPVVAELPAGVQAVRRGDFLFLLNHSDRAVQLRGISGYELISGSTATGHVVLAPRSGAVVTPQP